MAIHKLPFLVTVLFVQVLFFTNSKAQCSLRVDYKVESNSSGSKDIRIQSLDGSKNVKIQLYDLNTGQVVGQQEVFISSAFKSIFRNVKSSLYMVYIWLPGCNKPIVVGGDKQGILIEN